MGVAGEISPDSGPLQLHQNIQVFGESLYIYHIEHFNTQTITILKHHFHTLHSSTFDLSSRLEGSHMIYMR